MGIRSLRLRQPFKIVSFFFPNIIEAFIFPQCTFPSLTVEDLTVFHIFVTIPIISEVFIASFPVFAKTNLAACAPVTHTTVTSEGL